MLIAAFLIILALTGTTSAITVWGFNAARSGLDSLYDQRVQTLLKIEEISNLYRVDIVDGLQQLRDDASDEALDRVGAGLRDAEASIDALWQVYAARPLDPEERRLADAAAVQMKTASDLIELVEPLIKDRDRKQIEFIVSERLYYAMDPLRDAFVQLSAFQADQADQARHEAGDSIGHSITVTLVAAALIVLIILSQFYLITMRITRPLRAITDRMAELAAGATDITIPDTHRRGEIGEMARALEVFRATALELRRVEAEASKTRAQADAQRRETLAGVGNQLDAEVNALVVEVGKAGDDIRANARFLTEAAESTARQSTAAANSADHANSNVQTVAAASEQLSASIAEIARQMSEATRITQSAQIDADRTTQGIQSLSNAAIRIGAVVQLISAIAEQTNLLALNATIEAARAGDAGRGFAVVASEVKTLATQTAQATDQITEQIKEIQTETRDAVSAMGMIAGRIADINAITATVAAAVEQQGAATQEISRGVQEAAVNTTEVLSGVIEVGATAKRTDGAASALLSAADLLSDRSARLHDVVEGFVQRIRMA